MDKILRVFCLNALGLKFFPVNSFKHETNQMANFSMLGKTKYRIGNLHPMIFLKYLIIE